MDSAVGIAWQARTAQQAEVARKAPSAAGRFAPSPTSDLHLGNLRTALVAWLMARSTGRRFVVRIEDLDSSPRAGRPRGRRAPAARPGRPRYSTGTARSCASPIGWTCTRPRSARLPTLRVLLHARARSRVGVRAPRRRPPSLPGHVSRLVGRRSRPRSARCGRPAALRVAGGRAATGGPVHELARRGDRRGGRLRRPARRRRLRLQPGGRRRRPAPRASTRWCAATTCSRVRPGKAWLIGRLGGIVPAVRPRARSSSNPDGRRLAKRDGAVTLADLAAQGTDAEGVRSLLGHSLGLNEPGEPVDGVRAAGALRPRRPPPDAVGLPAAAST